MIKINQYKVLTEFIQIPAKIYPNKIALKFENINYTYKDTQEHINGVSNVIAQIANKGDVVSILMQNSPEMIFCYFGILQAGCIALIHSPGISDDNLIFQIKKTRPKIIISQENLKNKITRTYIDKKVHYIDSASFKKETKLGFKSKIEPDDTCSIIFTSGTTNKPKGVKLKHKNVVAASKNIISFLNWNSSDINVGILPLSHSFGLGNIHCVFAVGGKTILFKDSINFKKILNTIIKEKATAFAAVPATLKLIVDNYNDLFKSCDNYLRFVQTDTSLMETNLIKKIIACLPNTDFNYYYGLTEASRSTFFSINKHIDKISSIGQATPNVKIRIIDNNNKPLKPEQVGEICIKGDHVIDEYWKNPVASKKIDNKWMHTGDAGYLDKDDFLFFKGRVDDIINVSGEKVSPEEIEETVLKIPGVNEVAAIGIPDKLLGQVVKLYISTSNKNFDKKIIIYECRKKLEMYKVPRTIEIIKKIPKTENGKIKRSELVIK